MNIIDAHTYEPKMSDKLIQPLYVGFYNNDHAIIVCMHDAQLFALHLYIHVDGTSLIAALALYRSYDAYSLFTTRTGPSDGRRIQ